LTFRWPCIVINSYNKAQLDALISQIYFWNKTLHVWDSSSVHRQEFFTIHNILKFRWPCIVINSYNKTQIDALISQIYFWNKPLHVSDSSSVHRQEFFTIHNILKFWWPCIVINSYNKTPIDALTSQIYFWNKPLHVSDSSSVHHQEFFTINNILKFRWQCIVINSYNKPQLDELIPQIYFWNKTLHVSDSSFVHHQEFFTIHNILKFRWPCIVIISYNKTQLEALIYQIYFWNKTLHVWDSSFVHHQEFRPDPARKLSANLYDIYHCCVYSEKLLMMARVTVRNM